MNWTEPAHELTFATLPRFPKPSSNNSRNTRGRVKLNDQNSSAIGPASSGKRREVLRICGRRFNNRMEGWFRKMSKRAQAPRRSMVQGRCLHGPQSYRLNTHSLYSRWLVWGACGPAWICEAIVKACSTLSVWNDGPLGCSKPCSFRVSIDSDRFNL